MALTLVSGPEREPVQMEELKNHLRVDITADDETIEAELTAARAYTERVLRRALITQTWRLALDAWPGTNTIELPKPPAQSVDSIKYFDENDTEATFSSDNYIVDIDSFPGRIVLKSAYSWPSTTLRAANGIQVQFLAGYGDDPDDIPSHLRQAIKLIVGAFYEQRENLTVGAVAREIPLSAGRLLQTDRNFQF